MKLPAHWKTGVEKLKRPWGPCPPTASRREQEAPPYGRRHRQPSDPQTLRPRGWGLGVGSEGGEQEGTDRLLGGWGGAPSVSVRPLDPAGGGGSLRTDPHHNTVWNGSFTKERILESMINYCNFFIFLFYYIITCI